MGRGLLPSAMLKRLLLVLAVAFVLLTATVRSGRIIGIWLVRRDPRI